MAARPWENRVFDTTSVSKDVFESYSVKSDSHEFNHEFNVIVERPTQAATTDAIATQLQQQQPRLTKPSSSYQSPAPAPARAPPVARAQAPASAPPAALRTDQTGAATTATSHYTAHRTTSQGGGPVTPPSTYKLSTPVLLRSASPRSIRRDDIEEVSTVSAKSMASRHNAARHSNAGSAKSRDDESLASSPSVPNYMQATQSAKAKVRSHSMPKLRPGTPEKDSSSWTKRMSMHVGENTLSSEHPLVLRPFRPSPYAQRSPSLRSDHPSLHIDPGDACSEVSAVRTLYT